MYKERCYVNPAVYMLPWYMYWYEKGDNKAIKEKNPKVAVYNEDRECLHYSHYTVTFERYLKKH